ncbi:MULTISPECIES: hypothetical protein [unclassified Paracoccus (in: a-proteobacteria)]|uniref:hypothetical protein n=1 Tax=unclassified Paracoccus (in: a-proteobacteria) TaxID=2688777 RepID=UPI0021E12486|nr:MULTISPECIES: hypothetical protein [unclassified Paracoccus (in: a-proteobacteria)]UXU73712.1 hypothetical protein GB879_007100 [Paracoccus sp. SMMA_5]UXU79602.1 hypothetical protein GB880_007090 [Paracoccus sp. SMMA_5_TC]
MAGILTADIDAPPAATLGIIPSLASVLGAIPGLVDVWRIDPARIARDGDSRVSAWTGSIAGRQFTQANALRRPLYVAPGRVDFGTGAAARATMQLAGTPLGQPASASIGLRLVLAAEDETTDNQSFAGQDLDTTGTGLVRLAWRYNAAGMGNYIRLQIGAAQRDVDLPAGVTDAMVWLTIQSGEVWLNVNGTAAASAIAAATLNLPGFAIGGSREGTPAFAGSLTGICIAQSALTPTQRAAAEWAMRHSV